MDSVNTVKNTSARSGSNSNANSTMASSLIFDEGSVSPPPGDSSGISYSSPSFLPSPPDNPDELLQYIHQNAAALLEHALLNSPLPQSVYRGNNNSNTNSNSVYHRYERGSEINLTRVQRRSRGFSSSGNNAASGGGVLIESKSVNSNSFATQNSMGKGKSRIFSWFV